jgi:subtilase family serine protease
VTMFAGVLAILLSVSAQITAQENPRGNRIAQELTTGLTKTLAGTLHPLTRKATDLGSLNSGTQLESMTLNIGLSPDQQTELNGLLEAQQDPKSPQYRHWLTQEEYGARFGLTAADLSKVSGWLTSQGLTVKKVSKTRNAIYFSGKAWQVESAFHTQLHQFQVDGETHFANATDLRVPAGLASVMLNIRGLNNFRPKPQVKTRVTPAYTVNTSVGVEHFLTPEDWATIYNVNALYSAGFTGGARHVGVVGQTYAPQEDIDHFRSASGLGVTNLTYVCIDPAPTTATCTGPTAISPHAAFGDLSEADLDIEWAGGIARDATVDFIYAPFSDTQLPGSSGLNVFDALVYAVQTYVVPGTGEVLPVISMSYGTCETVLTASDFDFFTSVGQQATAQGQTIVVSSGDSGVAGCDRQGIAPTAVQGVSATAPGNSPFYTAVGGTTLSGDTDPASFWNPTFNLVNSALAYIPETAWNETDASGLFTSGGGVSTHYPMPPWQAPPSNFVGTPGRFIPDVAFAAAGGHDGYMTCSQEDNSVQVGTSCSNGFISTNGFFATAGGTSAAAPSFAGMLTLLRQRFGNLVPLNPLLYGLAQNPTTYASVFHDVTAGNNIVPCAAGTPGCGATLTMGNSATPGYDLVTGLGSIDGGGLLAALTGTPGITATTTTHVLPITVPIVLGEPATIRILVDSFLLPTTVPPLSGSVAVRVGSTSIGTASVLGAPELAVTTLDFVASSANGFNVGTNIITGGYTGNGNYAPSVGRFTTTVLAPYSLVESGVAHVLAGNTISVPISLVSNGSYAGTVSFVTAVTAADGSATTLVQASASPVTLTPRGTATATLTVSTSSRAGKHVPAGPWKGGGSLIFCSVLMGAPFAVRHKRTIAVFLLLATLVMAGLLVACGGSSASPVVNAAKRTYTVTVTPTGSPAVPNPAPVNVVVLMQ